MHANSTIDDLITKMQSTNEDVVRQAIFNVAELNLRDPRVEAVMMDLLDSKNNWIRDAAAMSLCELGVVDVIPKLVNLISENADSGNTGSLVYALRDMDVSQFFLVFITQIIEGRSFEVLEMSIDLIEKNAGRIHERQKLIAMQMLVAKRHELEQQAAHSLPELDRERLNYINFAIDVISGEGE